MAFWTGLILVAVIFGIISVAANRRMAPPRETPEPKKKRQPSPKRRKPSSKSSETGVIYNADWARQGDLTLLDEIYDPRQAAATPIVRLVAVEGPVTADGKAALTRTMQEHFSTDAATAEGLYSFGRMALNQMGDFERIHEDVILPIDACLTAEEASAFLDQLRTLAALAGGLTPKRQALIDETSRLLALGQKR